MSSAARQTHHRRRSHSASAPFLTTRHLAADKWRPAFKRARPSSLRSPSYKDTASDESADRWRRGKRVRRDSSVSAFSPSRPLCLSFRWRLVPHIKLTRALSLWIQPSLPGRLGLVSFLLTVCRPTKHLRRLRSLSKSSETHRHFFTSPLSHTQYAVISIITGELSSGRHGGQSAALDRILGAATEYSRDR